VKERLFKQFKVIRGGVTEQLFGDRVSEIEQSCLSIANKLNLLKL
jgi:hypothetical protein